MNFEIKPVYMNAEGTEGSAGGSTSFDSVSDAVAELDRREQSRNEERKAARAEPSNPEADEEPDTDSPSPEDYEEDGESDEVANDEDQEDAPEPKPKAELVEIEQDGQKFNVPAALKNAFLRQDDYTRKTQEVASDRAQVHAAYEQTAQLAQGLQHQQQQLAQYAQAMLGQPPSSDMIQTDPQGYLAQRAAYEQRMGQFQALMGQGQELTQQQQALQEQQNYQFRAAEEKALLEHIPELRDPSKKRDLAVRLVTAAQKYGFTPQDVASVMDHRQVRLLKDFADMSGKLKRYESANKDVRKHLSNVAPKVQRPSAATADGGAKQQSTSAKNQFMNSGRTLKDVRNWARNTT